ncbi:hypothetical protein ANCCEY_13955 [Ancylostoma ceylanicum]|uniref:Uncharacterized protein n=1 Tax=Ancylostoma ceylanicum TaxID=53326 RepID=A0A0D6L6D2_9BILA|nr:hypothetical protein ANCCEY_13955 [Ancylostoma ceylanicum]
MALGMHFLIGIATDEYVILASDEATFAYGAVLADDSEFSIGIGVLVTGVGEALPRL